MKVWIENSSKPVDQLKGKSLFCKRLADELKRYSGIEIVDGDNYADVSINVIRIKHKKSKYKILRINGVWHDTGKDWRSKNTPIAVSLERADGVIYQSKFSKSMADKYLGIPKYPSRIIFNGSDPRIYQKVNPVSFAKKNVFITFSKWRPHKRLRDIIHSFILADIKDSQLLVVGNIEKSGLSPDEAYKLFEHRRIEYLGDLPQSILIPMVKSCLASVHLCWFDACPNSVIEAICAGIPVITNNIGGTHEIVRPSGGYICNIDEPYDLRPVDLYHPPSIDRSKVAEAMIKCSEVRPVISCEHVDIENIAVQYLRFIREVISQ